MIKKLCFIFASLCTIFLILLSCKEPSSSDDEKKDMTKEQAEDDKTYLEVSNNSQFDINVFFNSPSYATPWMQVKKNESGKKEIAPSSTAAGDGIYIQYLYPINNIEIPYYDPNDTACVQIKHIDAGVVNSIKVSELKKLSVNTKYLIIKNASESEIALYSPSSSPVTPLYQELYWIKSGDYRIYEFKGAASFKGYKLGNGLVNKNIEIDSIDEGNIYTVVYSDEAIELLSVSPIDILVKDKIWKMNLSQKTGKCLTADKFAPRENASDGYFFTGQISYDEELRNQESKPYKANISPSGEVTDSIVSLTGSPKMVASDCFVEKNGKRIVAGLLANSDGNAEPFIYGDGGCDFYITPKIENFDSVVKLIHKDENVYSLLYWTIDKETKNEGFGIYEITLDSFDKAEGKCVYATNLTDSDYIPEDFIYHDKEYAVMVQKDTSGDDTGDETLFMFIDTENYEVKSEKQKKFEKYLFNGFEKSNDGKYAVASGSYKSAITGKDMAAFIKLDLTTGEFKNNGEPLLFKPREASLNSNFSCLSIKNNTLFLAGFIDCVYDNSPENYSSGYPYIVSYDLEKEKKNWTQIYEDYEGFQIYSCHLSAIGTPLIELYNGNTKKSILASCGLLGEIPDNELNPLPRNPKITEVSAPVFDIILTDPEENEFKMAFAYNSSITLDMINSNLSKEFIIPDGKDILGWQVEVEDKSGNISRKNVDFPLTVTESITLYPVFMTLWISGSSGSGYNEDDGFWMDCPISELNGKSVLRLYFISEVQAFDRNYGKFVDDIGSWTVGTVSYAINDKYEEIPIEAPSSLKLGEEFYIDISLSDKGIVDSNGSVSPDLLYFNLGAWSGCYLRAYLF